MERFDDAKKSYQLALDWFQNTPNKFWYTPEVRLMRAEIEELMRKQVVETAPAEPNPTDSPAE